MEFFNQQEDVLDIQLTSYGKHLLADGKFIPKYYSFADDDVIYDDSYISGSELQNEAETRIVGTPKLKTQYVFRSPERHIARMQEVSQEEGLELPTFENLESFTFSPLGESELGSQKKVSFDMSFLKGEISGSSITYENGDHYRQNIPQIDATIKYKTAITPVGTENLNVKFNPSLNYGDDDSAAFGGFSEVYEINEDFDLQIIEDFILINLREHNVEDKNENFDIQVFEVLEETIGNTTIETLRILNFEPDRIVVENDILLDTPERFDYKEPTSNDVGGYFDVLTDEEIPRHILCFYKEQMQEDFVFDIDDCNLQETQDINPYDNIDRGNGIEVC